ncbi:MAG: urease accessory protein UreE [Chthoniobacteraceae bacterium]
MPPNLPVIRVPVDRLTLAKRRWRGVAEDGREFGFDLERPLTDGAAVFATERDVYVMAQKYELVLEMRMAECGLQNGSGAARVGWMIGNLHFPLEITDEVVRVADDPALRQLFQRENLSFDLCRRVFHPIGGGHSHGHHSH